MNRLMLTNCPNCGAPLSSDGRCAYCGTKARYANEIDLQMLGDYGMNSVEINLAIHRGDTVLMVPMRGNITHIDITSDSVGAADSYGGMISRYCEPRVAFQFDGTIVR